MPRQISNRTTTVEADEPTEERTPRSARTSRRENVEGFVKGRQESTGGTVSKGWGAYKKNKAVTSGGSGADFKVTDEEVLVKFLDDGPFATYLEHFLNEIKDGQRSFICLGEDCPLCDMLSDSPSARALFNVIDFSDGVPTLKVWKATPNPAAAIEARADNDRTSPINKGNLYFAVSKTKKKNGFFEYAVDPVKSSDLDEDWDLPPLTDEELAEFVSKGKDEEYVKLPTRKTLKDIAEDILDNE